MKPFELNEEQLLHQFKTSRDGLKSKEVEKRKNEFGLNFIEGKKKKNYLKEYLLQYIQFFPILLEIAGILALVADYYQPNEGNDILAYAIFGAVFINATFTFWQNFKADKAMEALLKLIPTIIKVRRNNNIEEIDACNLVPGDIIILEEGDKIAADAILLEANELYINTSSLDGESKPSKRFLKSGGAKRSIDAKNMVYAGTSVVNGSGEAVVVATGMATEFGKIATLTTNIEKGLTPLEKEIINMTKILTILALIAGVVFFFLGYFSGKGILIAAIFALSLIVANVPEGLLPTITLSLSLASQRMAQRNALIKNLASVETLGSVTTICTDKTGTLTKNEMTLQEIYLASGEKIFVSGSGYGVEGTFTIKNENPNSHHHLAQLLQAGWFNSRASIEEQKIVGDPTELALVVAAKKYHLSLDFEKLSENPFSSDRKMMSTFGKIEDKEILFVKGAPEVIFQKTTHYQDKDGKKIFDELAKKRMLEELYNFENRAFRVLAIAMNDKNEEKNLTLLGLVAIMDIARPEVKDALGKCYTAGIRTIMITGDNPNTAAAIGRDIGLKFDAVMSGDEVARLSDGKLQELLREKTYIFARMASHQKLKIADALQKNGEVIAMTGDGVNDAPSLRKADIGIAMGSGTDVAKEASDMILLDDNFNSIVSAIEEGRTVYFNIKKFVTYILSSNVPEIVPYVLSFFLKIPNPLSVIQILSIDLGSDMLPGLALGSEKPEKNIMKRPPVGKNEKILDWEVFKRGYFFIGIIEASAAMFAFVTFLLTHGWQYGQVDLKDPLFQAQAMTMTLLGAVTSQLANVWTMRSWDFNIWTMSWKSNKTLLFSMVAVLFWIWALLNVEGVQKVFNTASVPLKDLWILLPFPIFIFISHETYKYFRAKKIYQKEDI
ncbi:Lead, cadmium, zinc and mercury transporting ATPase; Copper-translocating P-type ATPase [hydrothermal vent metagenome]|uniref:Lead, cadmium, zinc and mercury transporting ATPase Copper-translocating P-type ATPase n=1 Tax=hydrothermal vent metagenome TaxID=652676 RepID=A0A1W1D1I3_9ZZZZ